MIRVTMKRAALALVMPLVTLDSPRPPWRRNTIRKAFLPRSRIVR